MKNIGNSRNILSCSILSENGESYKIQIDSLLEEIDSSVSIYKPYSIISKLNRGEKVQTDDIFNSVYQDAVHV